MNIPVVRIGVCLVFIFLSAFLSASETALFSIPREKIAQLSSKARSAKLLHGLLVDGQRTLYLLLLGNLFVNITLTGCIHALVLYYSPGSSPLMTMIIATFVIVVFGEMLPKNIALRHNELVGRIVAGPLAAGKFISSPLLSMVTRVNRKFLERFRWRFKRPSPFVTVDEMKSSVIESLRKGAITAGEQEILVSFLEQGSVPVVQCMEHRSRLLLLSGECSCGDALQGASKERRRYIYVFNKENTGTIEGVVSVGTLLQCEPSHKLADVCTSLEFVPESMDAAEVLGVFIEKDIPVVAVADEYGSFLGVVSVEGGVRHVFRPVFGTLDQNESVSENTVLTGVYSGTAEVSTLEWLPRTLIAHAAGRRTLSGVVTNHLGYIPAPGDKFAIEGWNFYILEASSVRIDSVLIKKRRDYDC